MVKGESMDNIESSSFGNQDLNKPIPFDDSGPSGSGVSHSPLDLGGGSAVQKPPTAQPKPVAKPTAPPVTAAKPAPRVAPTARIEGVKTFFTKLHPGAINFLDEQIARWLKENPGIAVKRTNIVVGEVQAKKTEPNILISVWY
jgi:hypothetical protein